MKGNATCHTPNDEYRKRYDDMTWDSDKKKEEKDDTEEIKPPCMDDI